MALTNNKFDNGEKDLASIQEAITGISAKDDKTHIDEYTDRFNHTGPTMKKMLSDGKSEIDRAVSDGKQDFSTSIAQKEQEFYLQVQYKPSIPWTTNTPVSDKTQLYSSAGDKRYRPKPGKVPFTTGATIDDDIANGLWIAYGEATKEWVSSNFSSANLISNHNFVVKTPDKSITPPDSTPRPYVTGKQIFSGWFTETAAVGLTYSNGYVNAASGTIYTDVPKSGAIAFITAFKASIAGVNELPITDGVSFVDNGSSIRVSVDLSVATNVFSVKLQEGSVADRHEVIEQDARVILRMSLDEAVAYPYLSLDNSIRITDRGDGVFDVVEGEIANGYDIINATASGYQLKLKADTYVTDSNFGVLKNSPATSTENTLAWNSGSIYAKANKLRYYSSGDIYTDNTLFFEAESDTVFIEPCRILRDNDTKLNAYGNIDIMSVKPVNSTFKSGWKLSGKTKLEYLTTTSAGDGINFDNSKSCDMTGFYCWIDKAHNAITGKSCFSIPGGVFAPGNCYTGLKLDPLESDSAGATCTSLYWTINCFNTVRSVNLVNVFYSEFNGYSDGVDLTSSKLPANQFPIGIFLRGGCRDVKFNWALENFTGIGIRQTSGQYATYSFDTQIGVNNNFFKDSSRGSDVPLSEQDFFSFEGAGTAIINNSAIDMTLPSPITVPTYIFYCGAQANITLNGGFFAKGNYGFSEGPGKHLIKSNAARFVNPYENSNILYHGDGTATQYTVGTTTGGGKLKLDFPVPFTNTSTNELLVSSILLRSSGSGNITYEAISASSITCVTDAGDGFVMRISVRGQVQN